MPTEPFAAVARLPAPTDNAAIAIRHLPPGTVITDAPGSGGAATYPLPDGVLEGHRFAVVPIAAEAPLLSWGLPFGHALRDLAPGTTLANERLLAALRGRPLPFPLPARPTFRDHYQPYTLDERAIAVTEQVAPVATPGTFAGYARAGGRGVGTRNYVVILAVNAAANPFVRALAEALSPAAGIHRGLDGVVPVTHTEGDTPAPHNLPLLLRALAGFIVHPNVAAALIVDQPGAGVTGAALREFMLVHGYPLRALPHAFRSLTGSRLGEFEGAATLVRCWLPEAAAAPRTAQPLAGLKLALQCGGSDAFSGVSGNPLAGAVARELLCHGGSANLAETTELVGAESYVLQRVRDLATARRFLAVLARYRDLAGRHGHSPEGNPSGGNFYRGLANIVLKSLGAATKKAPDVRLDAVLDYAERMTAPGYYFMDSPGNDLESIAGQVASGCNLIAFITGSGSVTNFPFVPTIKFVTTTARWGLLCGEMDVNAGAYLDGVPLADLTADAFALARAVAGGQRTVGETAGHAQVQLWRNWARGEGAAPPPATDPPAPSGRPLEVPNPLYVLLSVDLLAAPAGRAIEQVGLIVPASLCAGEVAKLIAARLNREGLGRDRGLSRFVALPHTEGCGVSGGGSEDLLLRLLLGHLQHPAVAFGLCLEHGCEKTHNDRLREALRAAGVPPERFGWASIQADGGIAAVSDRVAAWFGAQLATWQPPARRGVSFGRLRLGLYADGELSAPARDAMIEMIRTVASAGGLVVAPADGPLGAPAFLAGLGVTAPTPGPTLAYAASARAHGPGLHLMACPGMAPVEILSGLAATGVDVILAHVVGAPLAAQPLVPVVQVTTDPETARRHADDLDGTGTTDWVSPVARATSSKTPPRLLARGWTDFQAPRGPTGISL